jgi:hypothetical protein
MPSVYDSQARELLVELGKPVLVRDDQTVAPNLDVRQYYGYFLYRKFPLQYVLTTSMALEMLYIKKGENVPVCESVTFLLPEEFPKTYKFLRQMFGLEHTLEMRIFRSLDNLATQKSFVKKTGHGKYAILEEVRKKQILPDCLNIQVTNLDSSLAVKQL